MADQYIIGFDPGGTSGIAVLRFTETVVECVFQDEWGDPDNVWKRLHQLAHEYQCLGDVTIVSEAFDARPGIINPDYTPKYINRDVDNNIFDVDVVYQIPAQAKNLVRPPGPRNKGQDHLKRFGWYKKGRGGHANDATRHAITYGVETLKHMVLIQLGWPKPPETEDDE
jgi:hypothetical protein